MSCVCATGANALATASSSSSSSSIARNIQRQTMMASTSSSSSSSSANYSSRNRVMTNVFRRRSSSSSSSSSSSLQRSSGKTTIVRAKKGDVILEVSGLKAKVAETGEEILKGVDLIVREGETHAIMGKNGSGKSTLTKVLVGHPAYEVTGGTAKYKGEDLFEMEPEERARAGLFLSFQSPVEVPGVSNTDFLRMMCNERRKHRGEEEMDPLEFYGYLSPKLDKLNMDPSFMTRNVNEGFSGGEKKRNEILQLAVLESEMSILDEIDSGLDVDALRDVSEAVNGLKSDEKGLLLITHYQRLLDLIHPDVVHIMKKGKIVKTGDKSLASTIDEGGFAALG
jgi:Fe-S cluster assembly ATP-binding protein